MNRQWLVRSSGHILGPWTTEEIIAEIKQKKISALDEVCLPGERWRYLRQIEVFQKVLHSQADAADEVTLTDHGRNTVLDNQSIELTKSSPLTTQIKSEKRFDFHHDLTTEHTQLSKNSRTNDMNNPERIIMQKNQKIFIGITFLTVVCLFLLVQILQKSFQSKQAHQANAELGEQIEARDLANLAIWAKDQNVTQKERLNVFKKMNQWRIKHQYARRELLIHELQLAKLEQVEQSVLDRLAYEFTSVSYRPAKSEDLLLGPQPESECLQAASGIENSAIKNNVEMICQLMYGDLAKLKDKLPFNDEVTQQNNRQLLYILIEYYIKNEQHQLALDLLKKYQLTGTGIEESLRFQVCLKLMDSLCTTSPAK